MFLQYNYSAKPILKNIYFIDSAYVVCTSVRDPTATKQLAFVFVYKCIVQHDCFPCSKILQSEVKNKSKGIPYNGRATRTIGFDATNKKKTKPAPIDVYHARRH